MKVKKLKYVFALVLITLFVVLPSPARDDSENHPLQGFEWLVEGKWTDGKTVQELKWGINKQSVNARSFWVSEGKLKLVSEGVWFWHSGEKKIKGYFFAIDMPFSFVESEVEFDGTTLVHRMETYSGDEKPSQYIETFEQVSKDEYAWKLFSGSAPTGNALMSGNFTKK